LELGSIGYVVTVIFTCHDEQVLLYLETLEGVVDVKLRAPRGATRHELAMWEKVCRPYMPYSQHKPVVSF